jgi:DNA-binding CsgD family transcriptional regulator
MPRTRLARRSSSEMASGLCRPGEPKAGATRDRADWTDDRSWGDAGRDGPNTPGFTATGSRCVTLLSRLARHQACIGDSLEQLAAAAAAQGLRESANALATAAVAQSAAAGHLLAAAANCAVRMVGPRDDGSGDFASNFAIAISPTDLLTLREEQVAALVADGCSNSEIARTLVLSIRTVERHIENIYRKLGIKGRAARAALAVLVARAGYEPRP